MEVSSIVRSRRQVRGSASSNGCGTRPLEVAVVPEQFVARGDVDGVLVELDAAQAPVRIASFEVDAARIPVDVLHDLVLIEIDRIQPRRGSRLAESLAPRR